MAKYKFVPTKAFERQYKSFRKDPQTQRKIDKTVISLIQDPHHHTLKTHQVNIPIIGKCWSSRVTGDLRILWTFGRKDNLIIIGLRVGKHDFVYS